MAAKIRELRRFPLKGAASVPERKLSVSPALGVANDRRFALRRRPGDMTGRGERFNKFDYVICANTAAIAKERPDFVGCGHDYRLDPGYLAGLKGRLQNGSDVQLQDSRGAYHLADTGGPQVSFINLATLMAFEELVGIRVDPDRFRMNVWIADLPAFAEYEWVDTYPGTREIMVGNIRMRVDDACERCKAPDANPATGEYDMSVLAALMQLMEQRGYKSPHRGVASVMGIFGVVLNEGTINVGDEIRLL
jgi:uncharacterized protein YcbX